VTPLNYFGYQSVEQIKDMLRHPLKYGYDRYTSCNGVPIVATGLFTPEENFVKRIGQLKGKQRIAIYPLCQPCVDDYDRTIKRVEARILREAGVQ
jgi:hypothetical protein